MYDPDAIREIENSINLLDYVSEFIVLRRHGKDYFGHCPLHVDKTPSFSVNPAKNKFYCFSCLRGGGIISYLMQFEGLTKDEAIDKASRLAGVDLSKTCQSETMIYLKHNRREPTHDETVKRNILPESTLSDYQKEPIREWLDEGIQGSVMNVFGIMKDRAHRRIVYPVRDEAGNLINVKGRTVVSNYKELRIPKYINYFPVGTMDYFQGLDVTKKYIKEKNEIIIFESIKSVMKCYGWGYKNCVSAEKHTLTMQQIRLLIKLRVNIVFAYDKDVDMHSDAVMRNIEILKRMTNVYIVEDRDGLLGSKEKKNSPADCGKEVWEELYNNKRKVV